jgi:hypothetical protein
MSRLAHLLASAAVSATLALVGCNAVLGIDEATPRDDAGGASKALEVPIDTCDGPQPASCATCIAGSCKNSLDSCLKAHDCRQALNDYRKCLGAQCNDDACLAGLQAGPARDLASCALGATECPECPDATPLADVCALYCACMGQATPVTAEAGGQTCEQYNGSSLKDWTAGDGASCLAACRSLKDPAAVHCRWSHCELAQSGELALHCGHAIGDARCPLHVAATAGCKDKRINNWGCATSAQCCSDHCDHNICMP